MICERIAIVDVPTAIFDHAGYNRRCMDLLDAAAAGLAKHIDAVVWHPTVFASIVRAGHISRGALREIPVERIAEMLFAGTIRPELLWPRVRHCFRDGTADWSLYLAARALESVGCDREAAGLAVRIQTPCLRADIGPTRPLWPSVLVAAGTAPSARTAYHALVIDPASPIFTRAQCDLAIVSDLRWAVQFAAAQRDLDGRARNHGRELVVRASEARPDHRLLNDVLSWLEENP